MYIESMFWLVKEELIYGYMHISPLSLFIFIFGTVFAYLKTSLLLRKVQCIAFSFCHIH